MVSKAREDFPLPLSPVTTTNFPLGISRSIPLRLWALAPLISMYVSFPFIVWCKITEKTRIRKPPRLPLPFRKSRPRLPSVPVITHQPQKDMNCSDFVSFGKKSRKKDRNWQGFVSFLVKWCTAWRKFCNFVEKAQMPVVYYEKLRNPGSGGAARTD